MNADRKALYSTNPFSTCYVEPGAIAYLFADDIEQGNSATSCQTLLGQLRQHAWFGAIVGPHGSGKSTLLAALLAELKSQAVAFKLVCLHDGERHLPKDVLLMLASRPGSADRQNLLVIDGYEQLSRWTRWQIVRRCRRHHWGLLATSHATVNLPTLHQTSSSLAIVQTIVKKLVPEAEQGGIKITPNQVQTAFELAGGNIRETLFNLYDCYNQQAASEPTIDSIRK